MVGSIEGRPARVATVGTHDDGHRWARRTAHAQILGYLAIPYHEDGTLACLEDRLCRTAHRQRKAVPNGHALPGGTEDEDSLRGQ